MIRFVDTLGSLEQSNHDDATHDVSGHFLVFYQHGGQNVVVDEESDEEE